MAESFAEDLQLRIHAAFSQCQAVGFWSLSVVVISPWAAVSTVVTVRGDPLNSENCG